VCVGCSGRAEGGSEVGGFESAGKTEAEVGRGRERRDPLLRQFRAPIEGRC
jgi:hypothetical protein